MPTRRFGVLDIMLFIAATGIGLAIWRSYVDAVIADPSTQASSQRMRWYWYQTMGAAPLLSAWSLTLAALAFRQPRPGLRRLFRRPPLVVGLMVGVALLVEAFPVATYLIESRTTVLPHDKVLYVFISMPGQVGTALMGLGIIRALTGPCRRRTGWQDWLGWVLGAAWVLLGTATNFFRMLV
jgi:hypothetical protein